MRGKSSKISSSREKMIEKIILFLICLTIYFFPDYNLDPIFVFLFTLTGIIFIKKISSQELKFTLKIDTLTIAIVSLPISMFISILFSSYKYPSLLRLGEIFLIYLSFLPVSLLKEEEKKFTLNSIAILSLLHSLFSLSKYFIFHQQRASGNFLNPNHSAFVLLVGLILILARFLEEKNKIFLIFILPIIIALILSRSRSTLIALLIFLPLIFFEGGRIKRFAIYFIPSLLLLILVLIIIPNPISQYLLRTYDPFSFRRFQIWSVGIKMFMDSWIVGVGPSNFYYRIEPYRFPEMERIARYAITLGDAHNDFIQLLAELGALSIPFIFGVFLLSLRLLKNVLNSKSWEIKGSSIALLSIFFNSFFTNSIFHPPISFLIILLLSQVFSSLIKNEFCCFNFRMERGYGIILIIAFLFFLTADGVLPLISNKFLRKGGIIARTEGIEEGLKLIEVADKLTPLNSAVKKEIGIMNKIIYMRTENPFYLWRSVSAFREGSRLNPHESDIQKELAEVFTILLRRKGFEEAFKMAEFHWKKAISIAPFNPFYYYNLSHLYILTYNNRKAEETLKKCIELEPNYIMAHYSLYKIYEESGEIEKRDKEKKEVLKLIKIFGNKNYPSFYFNKLFAVPGNVIEEMLGQEK